MTAIPPGEAVGTVHEVVEVVIQASASPISASSSRYIGLSTYQATRRLAPEVRGEAQRRGHAAHVVEQTNQTERNRGRER